MHGLHGKTIPGPGSRHAECTVYPRILHRVSAPDLASLPCRLESIWGVWHTLRACAGSTAGASEPPSGAAAVSGRAPGTGSWAPPSAVPSGALSLASGMSSAATELLDALDQSGRHNEHGVRGRARAAKQECEVLQCYKPVYAIQHTCSHKWYDSHETPENAASCTGRLCTSLSAVGTSCIMWPGLASVTHLEPWRDPAVQPGLPPPSNPATQGARSFRTAHVL